MSARIFATLADVAAKTQREIDNYIIHSVNPRHPQLDRESIVKDLVKILGDRADATPSAFVLDSPDGRTLIVAYEFGAGVMMGPGSSFFTLRAYRATETTLKLINTAGEDMNNYLNLSVEKLPSPAPGQLWLLVWGQASGANGPNIRMRGYAFDGKKFKTVWMPANEWGNFTIRVNASGFTIDGEYYRNGKKRHDAFTMAPDGFYLVDLHQ